MAGNEGAICQTTKCPAEPRNTMQLAQGSRPRRFSALERCIVESRFPTSETKRSYRGTINPSPVHDHEAHSHPFVSSYCVWILTAFDVEVRTTEVVVALKLLFPVVVSVCLLDARIQQVRRLILAD